MYKRLRFWRTTLPIVVTVVALIVGMLLTFVPGLHFYSTVCHMHHSWFRQAATLHKGDCASLLNLRTIYMTAIAFVAFAISLQALFLNGTPDACSLKQTGCFGFAGSYCSKHCRGHRGEQFPY